MFYKNEKPFNLHKMDLSLPLPDRNDQRTILEKRSKDDIQLEKVKRNRYTPGYLRCAEKRKIQKRRKSFFEKIENYNQEKWDFFEVQFQGRFTVTTKEGEIVESFSSTEDFKMNQDRL